VERGSPPLVAARSVDPRLARTPGTELEVFEAAYAALALATGGRPEEWNAARWRTQRHVLRAFAHAREYLPEAWRQLRDDD
jgi:hypothetical protein